MAPRVLQGLLGPVESPAMPSMAPQDPSGRKGSKASKVSPGPWGSVAPKGLQAPLARKESKESGAQVGLPGHRGNPLGARSSSGPPILLCLQAGTGSR